MNAVHFKLNWLQEVLTGIQKYWDYIAFCDGE
jgi:hypothetical protein